MVKSTVWLATCGTFQPKTIAFSAWLHQPVNEIQKISAITIHAVIPEDTAYNYKLRCKGIISYECIMDSYVLTMTFLKHPEAATDLFQEALQILQVLGTVCR